jgi:hypothetical protein
MLEQQVREFESQSGWRVTQGARVVLQALIMSLLTDQIGPVDMPERRGLFRVDDTGRRRDVAVRAARGVGALLDELRSKAEPVADFVAFETQRSRRDVQEIGAVFLMQHIAAWSLVANCPSWPQ